MKRVTKTRFFFVWNLLKEQNYLEEQAKAGYHLVEVGLFRYVFIVGEPKDMVYRLDYLSTNQNHDKSNRQGASEWEQIQTLGPWQYFRKERIENERLVDTNLDSIKRINQKVLGVLMISGLPNYLFLTIFYSQMFGDSPVSVFFSVFRAIIVLFAVLHIFAITKTMLTIRSINRTMAK